MRQIRLEKWISTTNSFDALQKDIAKEEKTRTKEIVKVGYNTN